MKTRNIIFIVLSVLFLLVGGFYTYKIYDLNQKINETKTTIIQKQKMVDSLEQQKDLQASKIQDENLNQYYEYLPVKEEIPKLITSINEMANKNNVHISSLEISTDEKEVNSKAKPQNNKNQQVEYKTVTINLHFDGSYKSFRSFMNEIYQSNRLVNVPNGKWSVEGNKVDSVDASITLKAYYYPEMLDKIPSNPNIPTFDPENRIDPTK